MDESLRQYYETELSFLRQQGREFAERFPKIAARLSFDGNVSPDPHVERLIQGFAFLAGRIHNKLDDEFPEITEAFVSVLYPHLLRPVPSRTIVQFVPEADGAKLSGHLAAPRHTRLLTQPIEGMRCRFRTVYPVDVWPLRVAEARFATIEGGTVESRQGRVGAVLRLRIQAMAGARFEDMEIDRLRLFLDGEGPVAHTLYELLFNNLVDVSVSAGDHDGPAAPLPTGSIAPVGFGDDEGMLDYDKRSFSGYRLIQEYFAYPEKFLFFDIVNFAAARAAVPGADMRIDVALGGFTRAERFQHAARSVGAATFKLFCAPAINLFPQRGEPINLSHLRTEYPVIADRRWPNALEVYSVDGAALVSRAGRDEKITDVPPVFAIHGAATAGANGLFWHARRRVSARESGAGAQVYISLMDRGLTPDTLSGDVLTLSLKCSNRDLPALLPHTGALGEFELEEAIGGGVRIRCLRKPTRSLRAAGRRGAMWRLISHLSLNHITIAAGGRDALLEILNLYNFSDSAALRQEIEGIVDVTSAPAVARVGPPHRSAFCRGVDVALTFDEDRYAGGGVYLLAAVLERFFGLYCAANSFTRLTVRSRNREGVVAEWPPRMGDAILV